MREIALTQGQVTLVDDEDYDFLMQWKWFAKRIPKYPELTFHAMRAQTVPRRTTVSMHRVITNCPTGLVVDHINHNTLDNRRSNLRVCTNAENLANRRYPFNFAGGQQCGGRAGRHIGCADPANGIFVGIQHRTQSWSARIKVNQRDIWLGTFESAEEAARAYDRAVRQHFGEDAPCNYPNPKVA